MNPFYRIFIFSYYFKRPELDKLFRQVKTYYTMNLLSITISAVFAFLAVDEKIAPVWLFASIGTAFVLYIHKGFTEREAFELILEFEHKFKKHLAKKRKQKRLFDGANYLEHRYEEDPEDLESEGEILLCLDPFKENMFYGKGMAGKIANLYAVMSITSNRSAYG